MNRHEYIQQIIKSLTWLSTEVSVSNSMNFTDINVHSENFYRDLLNLAFDYELVNINILDQNAAAIDLGDEKNSIAIQITSTSGLVKTTHTVTKFIDKKLYQKYGRLIILNIGEKVDHRASKVGDASAYELDTKSDIWGIKELSAKINNLPTPRLKQVCDFLNEELHMKPVGAVPKNVSTIINLIELISDEEHPEVGNGCLEEPFPTEKIYKRFADHSVFLEKEYLTLYQDYGAVLDSVEKEADISPVKLRRAAQHLKSFSDSVLTECNADPKVAINKIVEYFTNALQSKGCGFDTGAVEFYIIKQLIMCNVFPNKEASNG
ncbi:SMEK domain-containing protein [Mariprofundus sp. NF]|nr:SMEK domain-containing protein [Mariprofundus sp. NF]